MMNRLPLVPAERVAQYAVFGLKKKKKRGVEGGELLHSIR